MVELDDLKSIILLSHLTDPMLEKLADVTMTAEYNTGDYIFREGDYARYLYAVIDGKVGLELEKTANTPVALPGRAVWEGSELEMLFYQDYEMGFLFMKRIAKIAKSRLQFRNVQFLDIYI